MADSTRILKGSFKGVPIRIDSGLVSGGRKTSKKEFPNRDTQTIEDLGLRPRSYNLQIVIAPITTTSNGITKTKQGYFEYRDQIISAIEDKSVGELIHPLYGRIENVKATTFSLNEDFSDFGRSRLNVTFEISNGTGIPKKTITSISNLTESNKKVITSVTNDITDNFAVSNKFANNFQDAKDKINEIIDDAVKATSFIGAAANEINEFNSFIGELSASVNSLITNPLSLANSISNLFSNINGLFGTFQSTATSLTGLFGTDQSTATSFTGSTSTVQSTVQVTVQGTAISFTASPSAFENTAKAFSGLFDFASTGQDEIFGFGSTDEDEILTTTAGLIQRKENRAVLNAAINTLALSYSYVNVSQIIFENVREIEEAADALEIQFQKVVVSGASNDVISAITDMRVIVQQFFDEQKVTIKQIINVNVYTTPARVLSYQYYAESTSAEQIIQLNGITDVSFVDGDVEIVTA